MVLLHRCRQVALMSVLLPVYTQAADSLAVADRAILPQPGDHALMFVVSRGLRLEAYDGMGIAIRKQLSRSKAERLTLSVEFDRTRSILDEDIWIQDPRDHERIDRFDTSSALEWAFLRLHYLEVAPVFHTYAGWGPVVSAGRDRSEISQKDPDIGNTSPTRRILTKVNVSGGLKAVFGAEWFVTPGISLGAEYGFVLGAGHIREDDLRYLGLEQFSDVRHVTNSFELDPLPVAFGLSVFF